MSYRIGIDFGTTNTVISYINNGEPEEFKYPANNPNYYVPSAVSKDKEDIGFAACGVDYVKAMKMFLPLTEEERSYYGWDGDDSPEEYIKVFFSKLLKADYNDSFENRIGKIADIVLCVPQVWSNEVSHVGREKLKEIFSNIGFTVSRIVSEPISAAAFFVDWSRRKFNNDFRGNLLVCDMGGGTFDVTHCHVGETGKIESVINAGNGTTKTGKGFAGVYFDETLIKTNYLRTENKDIDPKSFMSLYNQLQDVKIRTAGRVLKAFTVAFDQVSEEERGKAEIYEVYPYVFTYEDIAKSFKKIGDEIKEVLNKVYTPGNNFDAYFLTGGFNQFYLCRREIENFFKNKINNGNVFDSSVDVSISGKSISFGAALIANSMVNIDEKFPHSFGIISYRQILNGQGMTTDWIVEYTCLIEGGKNLTAYKDYNFSAKSYGVSDTSMFNFEFYVDINSDQLQRHKFSLGGFKLPNPKRSMNKWKVGFKIDLSQIVHVAFEDTVGQQVNYQLSDVLQFHGKLISN